MPDHAGPQASVFDRYLARRRVALGFVCALVVWVLARPEWPMLVAGGLVALAGEIIRIWAAGHLEKGCEVTASGPYRWLPHPLYLGSGLMGVGVAIASRSLTVALVVGLYLGLTIKAAIKTEEAALRLKFGDTYDAYRSGRLAHETRDFSFERALRNREHRTAVGVILAFALLALKVQ